MWVREAVTEVVDPAKASNPSHFSHRSHKLERIHRLPILSCSLTDAAIEYHATVAIFDKHEKRSPALPLKRHALIINEAGYCLREKPGDFPVNRDNGIVR
jgi:hypothetical protein